MSYAIRFHAMIEKFNPLNEVTQGATQFLVAHPGLYKMALLVNHVFRAMTMSFFMFALPYSFPVNMALCFGASLFYRVTVENNCAYKFALPAFAGAVTFPMAQSALTQLVSGIAFNNLAYLSHSIISFIPIGAYLTYVILTVDYDVDQRCR